MHRILSGRIGGGRSFNKPAPRRDSPSFLASLIAVTNSPSDVNSSSISNSKNGTDSGKNVSDGKDGASSGSSGSSTTGILRLYTNRLISFYTHPNGGRDAEDRTLSEILRFPDRDLEYHHDYIQWLFPLPERSPFNPNAPQIDQATAEAFRTRPELRSRLRESFVRMLSFYGFEVIPVPAGGKFGIQEGSNIDFQRKSRFWLRQFDHNHLRITRIIRCLRVLGLEDEAEEFYKILARVGAPKPGQGGVGQKSLNFWKRAAKRPLQVPPDDENYQDPEEEEDDDDEDGGSELDRDTGEMKLDPVSKGKK